MRYLVSGFGDRLQRVDYEFSVKRVDLPKQKQVIRKAEIEIMRFLVNWKEDITPILSASFPRSNTSKLRTPFFLHDSFVPFSSSSTTVVNLKRALRKLGLGFLVKTYLYLKHTLYSLTWSPKWCLGFCAAQLVQRPTLIAIPGRLQTSIPMSRLELT